MLASIDQVQAPIVASDAEASIAREAVAKLRPIVEAGADVELRVGESADIVPVPARALAMILLVLETMADRKAVSFILQNAELTTQQAADYLNVSRPFLVGVLERGELPFRKVGTHRRVWMADLQAYKDRSTVVKRAAIADMVANSQALDLP